MTDSFTVNFKNLIKNLITKILNTEYWIKLYVKIKF